MEKSNRAGVERNSGRRFRLLETLREYAAEQLTPEERDRLGRGHANYYVALAEQAEMGMRGPEQRRWLQRLEQELGNLRVALDWSVASGDADPGLRLISALTPFWYARGYGVEGAARWAALQAVPAAAERTRARAKALCRAGLLLRLNGNFAAAYTAATEALSIFRELNDPYGIGLALKEQGYRGPLVDRSRVLYEESLAIFRELGDRWEVASLLTDLAWGYAQQGDQETARAQYAEALAIFRELGDQRSIAWTLHGLGQVALHRQEWDVACSCFGECLALFRELGSEHGSGHALMMLGQVQRKQGKLAAARSALVGPLQSLGARASGSRGPWSTLGLCKGPAALEESHRIFSKLSEARAIAWSLTHLGDVLLDQSELRTGASCYRNALTIFQSQGEYHQMPVAGCVWRLGIIAGLSGCPERAVRLIAAAQAVCRALDASPEPHEQPRQHEHLAALRLSMGEAAFSAAWAAGEALTGEQVAALALDEPEPPDALITR